MSQNKQRSVHKQIAVFFQFRSVSNRVSFHLTKKLKNIADNSVTIVARLSAYYSTRMEISMIKIAVVDDEKQIREQIRKRIQNIQINSHVDTYSTGEELLAGKKYYDVIFLDIQMDGMNGIETAKKLRAQSAVNGTGRKESILIFITGIKEYVFDAFDVAAFHYLLKPIQEKKFTMVLERAISEVEKRKQYNREQFFIKTRTRNLTLDQSSILYIESRAKKVEIHTVREIIEIYAAISELERQLSGSFYRCHRGYLVNMAFIAEYDSSSITLSNGEDIILTKDKYSEFVKVYMRYLKEGGTACV